MAQRSVLPVEERYPDVSAVSGMAYRWSDILVQIFRHGGGDVLALSQQIL